MNTKTIRFLSVLAVLAMVFAAVAVVVPAQGNDAVATEAVNVYEECIKDGYENVSEIDSATQEAYYFSEDSSVKVTTLKEGATIYVNNGVTVELKFKDAAAAVAFTIVTVSGDRAAKFVYLTDYDAYNTAVSFTPENGSTFEYKAATIKKSSEPAGELTANATFYYSGLFAPTAVGSNVNVAAGEEIYMATDTTYGDPIKFGFGISYVDKVGNTDRIFYSAPGAKVSKQDVSGTNSVTVKSGTVTVTNSGAQVTLSGIYGAEGITVAKGTANGAIALTLGTLTFASGDITLSGTVEITAEATITKNVNLTVAYGANVSVSGALTNEGKITLRNDAGLTAGTITNNSTVVIDNAKLWEDATAMAKITGNGFVDARTVIKAVTVDGGDFENMTVTTTQRIILTGNATITNQLIVEGSLVIREGVTLTMADGSTFTSSGKFANVENNGTIMIKATQTTATMSIADNATFWNNGSLTTSSTSTGVGTITISSDKFENAGNVTVSKNDKIVFTDTPNEGTITILGTIEGTVENEGAIVLTSATVGDTGLTINNAAVGAYVKMTQVTVPIAQKIKVTDTGIADGTVIVEGGASVEFGYTSPSPAAETTKYTIRGVTVTGATAKVSTTTYSALDIAGNIAVAYDKADTTQADVVLTGYINVSDSLSVPALAKLSTTEDDATITVTGTMTMVKNAGFVSTEDNLITVNVTGRLVDNTSSITPAKGVSYDNADSTVRVTTTFENALSEAIAADIDQIKVYGTNDASGTFTIPAGMYIDAGASAKINLKSGSITVEDTAYVASDVTVTKGILYFVSQSSRMGDIKADIAVIDEDADTATYMNLATAATIPGEYKLAQNVTVSEDLKIPATVIVDINSKTLTVSGCELVVDGTLVAANANTNLAVKDTHTALASFIVNGYFYYTGAIESTWWYPSGVHYETTVENVAYDVITSVDNIAVAIANDDDGEIDITGDVKGADLTLVGSDDKEVVVTFDGNVTASEIAMSDVQVKLTNGKKIDAEFSSADGSIVIRNAQTTKFVITENDGLSASGTVTDIADTTVPYYIGFFGEVAVSAFTADMDDTDYGASYEYPEFEVDGTLTAQGKSVTIGYPIIVDGSLIADNSAKITIKGGAEVIGSLIAKEKTESASAGAIVIEAVYDETDPTEVIYEGYLVVGALIDDLFTDKVLQQSGAATVSGDVTFAGTVGILEGSYIDPEIVEDLYDLTIQVDGEDYLYFFNDTGVINLSGLVIPTYEAQVYEILDADGEEYDEDVIALDFDYNAIAAGPDFNFTTEKIINVTINTYVYTVQIKTDAGIKSVALNGVEMVLYKGDNVYKLEGLEAGTYKVTYTLKSGYEGTPVITTGMGTIIKGYDIAVSGDYDEIIEYQLTGTEKEIEPEPVTPEKESEWTVTTILLVILVILIAIMAVIVALRLNRN